MKSTQGIDFELAISADQARFSKIDKILKKL